MNKIPIDLKVNTGNYEFLKERGIVRFFLREYVKAIRKPLRDILIPKTDNEDVIR